MTQTYFDPAFGILVNPEYPKTRVEVTERYPYLQCPYCLYGSESMNDFIVLGKKGNISKKMAWCPKCHVTLRRSTLVATGKMDLEQYGRYLASLANWDVDKRVKWHLIFEELKKVSYEERSSMWDSYRKEKARINPEYANRLAEKEANKQWEESYGNMTAEDIEKENKKYIDFRSITDQHDSNSSV